MIGQPTAAPTCQTIELQLTGYPDEPYQWGGGSIRPARAVITILNDSRSAHLYGTWVNEDGESTSAPANLLYRNDDTWPAWLAALADEHRPSSLTARPGSLADDRDGDDPRAGDVDSLHTQRKTARQQAATWTARAEELSRIINQREAQEAAERTSP